MTTALAIAAIGVSVLACTTTVGGTGGTIDGTSWVLTSYDVSGTSTPVAAGLRADARFTDGTILGSSGCNAYTADVTVSGATIEIGPMSRTLIGCDGPAAELESAYLANLANAASFTATTDTLTLFDSSGKAILTYAAAPANPAEGAWTVTAFNNGQEAVISPLPGTTLTAEFTADQVSGSSGCNTYSGGYTWTGDTLTIGPLASTEKACEPNVMDQEAQFLTALQTPATVESSGGTVKLRDAEGAIQVTLVPN